MVLPDANVLVNAFRDEMPAHKVSAGWLERQINGPAAYGMSDRVIEGFLRVVTLPGLHEIQVPVEEAIEFTEVLLKQPNCVRVNPGQRQWPLFLELVQATGAVGNAISDAWLAALAMESGSEWISWDRGFAKYPGLNWSLPSLAD